MSEDGFKPEGGVSSLIYAFAISFVGAILFVAVDKIEPNRRYALVLKFLIVLASFVAIAGRMMA